MKKQIALILAEGFEETEAITPADILTRLGYQVLLTGLSDVTVTGAHGIRIQANTLLSGISGQPDAVVLPGGLPGAINLRDSAELRTLLRRTAKAGKLLAAICAAPCVLAEAGLIGEESVVTGYPGSEKLTTTPVVYSENRTESDGKIITGKGPGAAAEFAFAIASALGSSEAEINEMKQQMFIA